MIEAFINLGLPILLVVIGYFFGRHAEKKHYRSIFKREKRYAALLTFSERFPPIQRPAPASMLVTGSVVISVDHFKRFIAGLKTLIGGRLTSYETLLDRARREAILRMKERAHRLGADSIFNVKLETLSIAKGERNAVAAVEVLAYGTALIPRKSTDERNA
jgi:uncharacterized protein YbjQ (UPF0145 family)